MNILHKIIANKSVEIENRRELKSIKLLEQSIYFETKVVSMKSYLRREDRLGVIAEIKRSAPSTGTLKEKVNVEELSIGYMQAGATALSILTDNSYFSGNLEDLTEARKFNYCPILQKDFIIDEYQVIEAKSIGADCILLIAAGLTKEKCRQLAKMAKGLGLEVLLEVHHHHEIDNYVSDDIDIVGVNNRNLLDFTTDISTSIHLSSYIPDDVVKISESGLSTASQIILLKEHGFQGFLMGTCFMKHSHPDIACRQFIEKVKMELE